MKRTVLVVAFLLLCFAVPLLATTAAEIPEPGMVTMVDLGSHKCMSCRMMLPILEKLKQTYNGKAAIVFIDIFEEAGQARKFNISLIPTQIFFDSKGQEVFRHQGFMSEEKIIAQLQKLGVQPPGE